MDWTDKQTNRVKLIKKFQKEKNSIRAAGLEKSLHPYPLRYIAVYNTYDIRKRKLNMVNLILMECA